MTWRGFLVAIGFAIFFLSVALTVIFGVDRVIGSFAPLGMFVVWAATWGWRSNAS